MPSSVTSQASSSRGGEPDQRGWKKWSIEDWNRALFNYFFLYESTGTTRPVRTIHLAGSVWNQVVNDREGDCDPIREAFVETIRRPPKQFRAAYSADRLSESNEWNRDEIPPFVCDLIFTCLVAVKPHVDGEVETNFRERVRLFMEHPEGTYYQFQDLSLLWEAFSGWLGRKHVEGWTYRRLELPNRGAQNLIGYSTKLAVPEWRDQRRLSKVLEEDDIDEPGVRQVLNAVAESSRSFSGRFNRLYEDFREEYEGGTTTWGTHPFWTAVERAATLTWDTRSSDKQEKCDAQVAYEVDSFSSHGTLNLYLTNKGVSLGEGMHLEKRTIAANTEWYLVQFEESSSTNENDLFSPDKLVDVADVLSPQTLRSGVRDGVLLFAYNEYGIRELQGVRPRPETNTWALVRESLKDTFSKLFTGEEVDIRESAFDSWVLVGPFQFQDTRPHRSWPRRLANISVLQPTGKASNIHFKGGVRVPDGFMGTERFLPVVRAEDADKVILKGPLGSSESSSEELELGTDANGGHVYHFPEALAPLEGKFSIIARREHHPAARREVRFRSGFVSTDYKLPSDEKEWMAEGALTDTIVSEELDRSAYPPVKHEQNLSLGDSRKWTNTSLSPQPSEKAVTPASHSSNSAASKAMELVGAIGNRRKGIREGEFLDLIDEAFQDIDYKRNWDIARAWEEVGYVDRLKKRTWNTGKYFPRRPELVYKERRGELVATLVGLSPASLRRHLRSLADDLGASVTIKAQRRSDFVAPILSWNFGRKKELGQFANRADLVPPKRLRPLEDVAGDISRVLDLNRREEPLHYKQRGTWNWNLGEFRQERGDHCDSHEVEIEWYQRKDSPDYFRVARKGNPIWWTHSRNWALLVGYALEGRQPFQICGRWLARTDSVQFYLPIPLARWVTVHTGHPPGPINISDEEGYGYRFCSKSELSRLVSLIWSRNDEHLERRLKWILQQADQSRHRLDARFVPIPSDIVESIQESGLDIALSNTRKVPPYLIPHLNKLTSKI